MRTFTKKQVKGWLNVMSKDATRPALCGVKLSDKKAWLTDGYIAVSYDLSDGWTKELENRFITREALTEWCKEHTTKAELSVEELGKLAEPKESYKNYADRYPDLKQIFDKEDTVIVREKANLQCLLDPQLVINAIGVLDKPVIWETPRGEFKPARIISKNFNDVALIMPLTK